MDPELPQQSIRMKGTPQSLIQSLCNEFGIDYQQALTFLQSSGEIELIGPSNNSKLTVDDAINYIQNLDMSVFVGNTVFELLDFIHSKIRSQHLVRIKTSLRHVNAENLLVSDLAKFILDYKQGKFILHNFSENSLRLLEAIISKLES